MENWRIRQKKRRDGAMTKSSSKTTASNSTKSHSTQQIPLMNRDTIRLIGEFSSPRSNKPLIGATTITMNKIGEIFFLCEDGAIRYLSSKSDQSLTEELNLAKKEGEDIYEMDMSHLEFNYSNTTLLIGGSKCIGVIFMKNNFHDSENLLDFQICFHCPVGDSILKVQWHPLSDTHLVVLLQNQKVLIIDVLTNQVTEIPLDGSQDYISFTFGPCVDWMRLCLFLLDSTGGVSYLCPVLPYGAILSSHSIYELKEWVVDEKSKYEEFSNASDSFLDNVDLYLRASFGTYFEQLHSTSEIDEESYSEPSSSHSFHRAGVPRNGTHLTPGTLYHKSFHQIPQLQGPLTIEERIIKSSSSSSTSLHRGDDSIPCDICVAVARGYNTVPVLLIVWSDGNIEELLLSGQISPRWKDDRIENSFSESRARGGERERGGEKPALVHMETLSLNLSQNLKETSRQAIMVSVPQDEYYLIPDPILGHSFHLIGPTTGVSYLIYLNWLEKEFDPSSSTHFHPENSYDSLISTSRSNDQESSTTNQFFPISTVLITCDGNKSSPSSSSSFSSHSIVDREISGVFICPDPTQGHVELVRFSDGYLSAVNITIQRKLLQLEGRIKTRNSDYDNSSSTSSSSALSEKNIYEQKEYSLQWISQKLIKKALVGIETVPYMGGNRKASASECLEGLLQAKQHLDSHVILPLEQLYQRMRFNEQIIRDVYEGQVAIITGNNNEEELEENNPSNTHEGHHERKNDDDDLKINGLENKIKLIQQNQRKLKERIENVGKKLIQQKNLSASALSASQASRNKISYAERSYYLQLQSWQEMSEKLEKLMTNLTTSKEYLQPERYSYPTGAGVGVGTGRGGGSTIHLTQQEEEICENLLGSQGEALKVTNGATVELEERLHSFM